VGVLLGLLWLPAGEEALATLTGGVLPARASWELTASLATIVLAASAAVVLRRRGRLAHIAVTAPTRDAADWFGIPLATQTVVVTPTLIAARATARYDVVVDGAVAAVAAGGRALARQLRRGDDRVVDAGVRGVAALAMWVARVLDRVAELTVDGTVTGLARLIGAAGRDSRRVQTGQAHTYYALIAIGLVVLIALTAIWSN
jgi:NADH-quinone oxidoreductase subunit L